MEWGHVSVKWDSFEISVSAQKCMNRWSTWYDINVMSVEKSKFAMKERKEKKKIPSHNIDYLNVDHVPSRVNHYTVMYPVDGTVRAHSQSIGQFDSKNSVERIDRIFLAHQMGIFPEILIKVRVQKS